MGTPEKQSAQRPEHIRPNTPEYTECTQAHPGGVTRCIHGSNLVAPGRRRATKSISVLSSQDQGADSCQRGIVGGHCSCRFELRLHFPNGAPILQPARQSRHWQASRADPQEGLQLADGVRRSGLPCNTCQQELPRSIPHPFGPGEGNGNALTAELVRQDGSRVTSMLQVQDTRYEYALALTVLPRPCHPLSSGFTEYVHAHRREIRLWDEKNAPKWMSTRGAGGPMSQRHAVCQQPHLQGVDAPPGRGKDARVVLQKQPSILGPFSSAYYS